ncbi:MAG: hypothetical protein IKA80_04300 [Spirochaetaceae bacterium]|nr:hypothetical protein [Spirochaetaceae bacterium]
MQKKVLVVAAMLALFVCGGAFAQEAEVPETEAPVAETPEAEAPAAESSGGGGSSILDSMYAGLDIGLGVNGATNAPQPNGFLLSPKVGIAPITKLPKLAFQFGFDMVFGTTQAGRSYGSGSTTVSAEHKTNLFLPYLGATWTFSDWVVRPYLGLGFGIAFETNESYQEKFNEYSAVAFDVETDASFATKIAAGAKYAIPNTNFELNVEFALAFFNPQRKETVTKTTSYPGGPTNKDVDTYDSGDIGILSNIVIGAVYHF